MEGLIMTVSPKFRDSSRISSVNKSGYLTPKTLDVFQNNYNVCKLMTLSLLGTLKPRHVLTSLINFPVLLNVF